MSFNFEQAEIFYKKKSKILSEKRIEEIKKYYPELKKWKNSSIDNMWTKYSLAIYMTKDPLWIKEREEAVLAFIWINYNFQEFNFGLEGMFEDYLKEFAKQKSWLNDNIIQPKWIEYSFLTE